MNRILGALLGTGALVALAGALLRGKEERERRGIEEARDRMEEHVERIDAAIPPLATVADRRESLPAVHDLEPDAAERIRADARLTEDKATTPERETMFGSAEESGEAGSMVRPETNNDRNLIGRQGA